MLFSDAHLHVNSLRGIGAEKVARRFKREGGWFMAIIALPPYHYGFTEPTIDSYKKALNVLIGDVHKVKNEGLKVAAFMGVHPAEIEHYYRQGLRGERAFRLLEEVLKLLETAFKEGLIQGIGEVGRPHYSTSPERAILAEVVMMRSLILAKDLGALVQLHLEQGGYATAYSIKLLVDVLKLDVSKVVIHHASLETAKWAEELGLLFTAPIKQFDEKYVSLKALKCMVESDFLDDPTRPGTSAYPWEIPRVISSYVSRGLLTEDYAYKILVDNVVKYFGVEPP